LRYRRFQIIARGVLTAERVVCLSWGEAKELNMLKMGVDPVKLELITERG
jgi:rare lipoprotein A (peptidoglycan hydrolase)